MTTYHHREFVVCSPVPAMLAGGRLVASGEVVTVDPELNAPLIRAGILTPVQVHEALTRHHKAPAGHEAPAEHENEGLAHKRPTRARRRPTKPTE